MSGVESAWALKAIASVLAEQGTSRIKLPWRWRLARRTSKYAVDSPSQRVIRKFLTEGGTLARLTRGSPDDADLLRRDFVTLLDRDRWARRRHDTAELREGAAGRVIPVLLNELLRVL